ncbi:hypothetical protein BpHYR1_005388 [Brachionus plicatilis]|uniref:Uncharacterized protein n=1 Tax=Brachionus plicatilis TaxID=10195 RepID=A0A3M7R0A6_BRAPC|nr:hypothetical protein BpHYR1_005388 [Brachionus plicatilis]
MQAPRCISKWKKKRLRYAVLNQNKEFKGRTGRIMAQAFRYWVNESGLSFRRVGRKKCKAFITDQNCLKSNLIGAKRKKQIYFKSQILIVLSQLPLAKVYWSIN